MTNQQNVPSNKKRLMYSDVIANLNALFQERIHRNVSDQFVDTKNNQTPIDYHNVKLIKTKIKAQIFNEPNLISVMKFNPKRGYCHLIKPIKKNIDKDLCTTKSSYQPLLIRKNNEDGSLCIKTFKFSNTIEINEGVKFISDNFTLFDVEELEYLHNLISEMTYIDLKTNEFVYGISFDELKIIYKPFVDIIDKGLRTGKNELIGLELDTTALEILKDNVEISPSRKLKKLKIDIASEFQIKKVEEPKISKRDNLTDKERGKIFLDELKAKGPDHSNIGKVIVRFIKK